MLSSRCYHTYMNRKELAVQLRAAGYSYSYIKEQTGLSQGTLSYHLARIPYSPNEHTKRRMKLAQLAAAHTKAKEKLQSIAIAQKMAKSELKTLHTRDVLIAGIALYAGEGSKSQETVRLVNADAKIIQFFIRWLKLLGLADSNIVLRVHAYPETDIQKAEAYWLRVTKLPRGQLQPACIDRRVGKDRKRSGVHKHGTAHVTVRSNGRSEFGVALYRRIRAYMDVVLG